MTDVALQMLYGDRSKYLLLISGVCFSAILMAQGLAMFYGILGFSYATLENARAPIWVVDPKVEQVADNQPLKDTDVDRVRSVAGVAWAAPFYTGGSQARVIGTGQTKPVTLVGLDSTTLAGAPTRVVLGSVLDLRRAQSVAIDQDAAVRLSQEPGKPLKIGDAFEMNDQRAEVVAIVKTKQGQGGASYVFTTFDRARQYGFSQRKMTTHVLAAPQEGLSAESVAEAIMKETGLRAYTEASFKKASSDWMIYNSPIPFVVGLIVGIGFLVGVIVAGQTFYNFVLENTRYLGALKAMGASNWRLARMTILQASIVGFTGYCIGMGLLSLFFSSLPEGRAPLLLKWQVAALVFAAVSLIVLIASAMGVRRVTQIEAAIVFRS
jgi:putative ABC transport system permease protein